MNMPRRCLSATKASAAVKSNTPGCGATTSAFITFSAVTALKWQPTSAAEAASLPETMSVLTAVPIRKPPAYASLSAVVPGVQAAEAMGETAMPSKPSNIAHRKESGRNRCMQ